jgi:predicted RNase H-like HicB family nuclease
MKEVYAAILTPGEYGYTVYIPDWDIYTQGCDISEAMDMARDALGLMGIDYQDDNKEIPQSTDLNPEHDTSSFVALIDIDFDSYRKAHDNRAIRKNVTIPSWLNTLAEEQHINFSSVLQSALKEKLNIRE